jgi:hypothetical protein
MKLYTVSTTRNGVVTNVNYNTIPANDFDSQLGVNYHLWYPVEIPEGTNSWFKGIVTGEVDATTYGWVPNADMTVKESCITQERLLLIYNDSNQTLDNVRVFISDQQLTGSVAEVTPWKANLSPEIRSYSSFEILSTSPVNQFPANMYLKANFQGALPEPTPPLPTEMLITNMQPYSWAVAAVRLYIVKDQEVPEDYCVISTETF